MRRLTESQGSILIWTLLLGISLATVFFFFSQRLNANVASQRETIQYQNARLYFESYIAYIQSLNSAQLTAMRIVDDGNISFGGDISGTLTNEVESISGLLDAGASVTYKANPGTGNVRVEWDACPSDATEIIEINDVPTTPTADLCGTTYDKAITTTDESIKLKALAGPTSYELTQTGDAVLYDKKWQLDLELGINFRKKLTTSLIFIPN